MLLTWLQIVPVTFSLALHAVIMLDADLSTQMNEADDFAG